MDSRIRSTLEAIANHSAPRIAAILFVVFLVATAILGLTQNLYNWADKTPPRGVASIDVWKLGMVVGSVGTASAFLATLYVAQRNYLLDRKHIPHLTITLTVERTAVSKRYDVIAATVEAQNTGSGLCTVTELEWTVVAVSPYDDEVVDRMKDEFKRNSGSTQEDEFPWHEVAQQSVAVDMLIEPGETEQLTQEFVIESEIGATITSAYVVNSSYPRLTKGWYRRTVHVPLKE